MSILRLLAVPAALALLLAAAPSTAQDKPTSNAAAKPGATSPSKASRAATQAAPLPMNGVNAKAAAQRTGATQVTPAAAPSGYTEGRKSKSCHDTGSDA